MLVTLIICFAANANAQTQVFKNEDYFKTLFSAENAPVIQNNLARLANAGKLRFCKEADMAAKISDQSLIYKEITDHFLGKYGSSEDAVRKSNIFTALNVGMINGYIMQYARLDHNKLIDKKAFCGAAVDMAKQTLKEEGFNGENTFVPDFIKVESSLEPFVKKYKGFMAKLGILDNCGHQDIAVNYYKHAGYDNDVAMYISQNKALMSMNAKDQSYYQDLLSAFIIGTAAPDIAEVTRSFKTAETKQKYCSEMASLVLQEINPASK